LKLCGIVGKAGSGKDTAAEQLVNVYGFQQIAFADPLKRYAHKVFGFTEEQLWGPSHLRNDPDPRFAFYNDAMDASDAWLATETRAAKQDALFVHSLIPTPGLLPGIALDSLRSWRLGLARSPHPISPRVVLQSLGTEWGRTIKEDLWLSHALDVASMLMRGGYTYSRTTGAVQAPGAPALNVVMSDVRFENELDALKSHGGFLIRVRRTEALRGICPGIQDHASETAQEEFSDEKFDFLIQNNKTLEEFLEAVDVAGNILTRASTRPPSL